MAGQLAQQLGDLQFVEAYRAQGRDARHRDLLAQQARLFCQLRDEHGREPVPYPQAAADIIAVAEAEGEDRHADFMLRMMGARRSRG